MELPAPSGASRRLSRQARPFVTVPAVAVGTFDSGMSKAEIKNLWSQKNDFDRDA